MSRKFRDLPGRQVGEYAGGERSALGLQAFDLFRDINAGIAADEFEFLDLGLELRDRLFKFQKIHRHEDVSSPRTSFRGPYTKYHPSRPTSVESRSKSSRVGRTHQVSGRLTLPLYAGRFIATVPPQGRLREGFGNCSNRFNPEGSSNSGGQRNHRRRA